jgi:hypothetical protein
MTNADGKLAMEDWVAGYWISKTALDKKMRSPLGTKAGKNTWQSDLWITE